MPWSVASRNCPLRDYAILVSSSFDIHAVLQHVLLHGAMRLLHSTLSHAPGVFALADGRWMLASLSYRSCHISRALVRSAYRFTFLRWFLCLEGPSPVCYMLLSFSALRYFNTHKVWSPSIVSSGLVKGELRLCFPRCATIVASHVMMAPRLISTRIAHPALGIPVLRIPNCCLFWLPPCPYRHRSPVLFRYRSFSDVFWRLLGSVLEAARSAGPGARRLTWTARVRLACEHSASGGSDARGRHITSNPVIPSVSHSRYVHSSLLFQQLRLYHCMYLFVALFSYKCMRFSPDAAQCDLSRICLAFNLCKMSFSSSSSAASSTPASPLSTAPSTPSTDIAPVYFLLTHKPGANFLKALPVRKASADRVLLCTGKGPIGNLLTQAANILEDKSLVSAAQWEYAKGEDEGNATVWYKTRSDISSLGAAPGEIDFNTMNVDTEIVRPFHAPYPSSTIA